MDHHHLREAICSCLLTKTLVSTQLSNKSRVVRAGVRTQSKLPLFLFIWQSVSPVAGPREGFFSLHSHLLHVLSGAEEGGVDGGVSKNNLPENISLRASCGYLWLSTEYSQVKIVVFLFSLRVARGRWAQRSPLSRFPALPRPQVLYPGSK